MLCGVSIDVQRDAAALNRSRPKRASHQNVDRSDIQGLRALAVGSVMLYHLWPNRLTGGYVGVDVFFAISGYLITGHLLGEIDATGQLRPARFWARRAKRLLPASTLALIATTLAIIAWVPQYLWHQFLTEIAASTLEFQNWLLAHNAVDYLAANNAASPTQHFWSLAVEEQFYVGLPLLLLLTVGLARLTRISPRRLAAAALVLIVLVSLAYSVHLSGTTPGVAYFSTFTRAWEFGCGAVLAALRPQSGGGRHRSPSQGMALAQFLTTIGLVAIVVGILRFNATTPFPDWRAALPVLGAVMVLAAGERSWFASLGRWAPIALLGRISYAAYLWHWPMIAILPYAVHHRLDTRDKIAIIVATVLVAWASTRFIEDPIRFGPRLLGSRRPSTVAAWSALAVSVVLVVALGARDIQDNHTAVLAARTLQVVNTEPACLGAQAMDPRLAPCDNPKLVGKLIPDPAEATKDDANMAACWGFNPDGSPKVCHLGPQGPGHFRVLAIGDSHDNALLGVYQRMAAANRWSIDAAGNGGCYLTTSRQSQPSPSSESSCERWRSDVIRDANSGDYDAIIVTHSDEDRAVIAQNGETADQAVVTGLVQAWSQLPNVPIIAIRDNPFMPPTEMTCVADHRDTAAQSCAVPRASALGFDGQAQAAQQVHRADVIDMTSLYCKANVCPPVIGHVLVYRDPTHITATWGATLFPYINSAVLSALSRH
jgi:peptidoglycan/LPS O-acetylase OafA/YrhL